MHLRSYSLSIVQVPTQSSICYMFITLIQDNKVPARKDKRYHVSVIINQIKLVSIVSITTFPTTLLFKFIYLTTTGMANITCYN